jgi:hypothetical protein
MNASPKPESAAMAQILAFPQKPEDRLRAALRGLEDALAEQKEAFGTLRSNLATLGGAVSGLQTSLRGYGGALAGTAQGMAKAHAEASRLETTADTWLKGAR